MPGTSSRQQERYNDSTQRVKTSLTHSSYRSIPLERHGIMLIADLSSKFQIIRKLIDMSSSTIINHLKGIFDEHGIPERLISDNGPQYNSEECRVFSARYGFDHVASSPLYPRSNGFIEKTVQTVKKAFHKGEGRR